MIQHHYLSSYRWTLISRCGQIEQFLLKMNSESSELIVADPKVSEQQDHIVAAAKDGEDRDGRNGRQGNNPTQQEAVRTDPVKMLEPRKRRLDRQLEEKIPEIHIIGEIKNAAGICADITEGIFLRFRDSSLTSLIN